MKKILSLIIVLFIGLLVGIAVYFSEINSSFIEKKVKELEDVKAIKLDEEDVKTIKVDEEDVKTPKLANEETRQKVINHNLKNEKLIQEAIDLALKNEHKTVFWKIIISIISAVGAALAIYVALLGAWTGFLQYRDIQKKEHLDRATTQLNQLWEKLADKNDEVRASSIAGLQQFLTEDYKEFHERIVSGLALAGRMEDKNRVVRKTLRPVIERAMRTVNKDIFKKISWQGMKLQRVNLSSIEFEITNQFIKELKEERFPEDILKKIKRFKNKKFKDEEEFLKKINEIFEEIGEIFVITKESIILRHALKSRLDLKELDFRHSELEDSDFSGANLKGAQFDGASLKGVKFNYANMEGAFFENADLTAGASFKNAILKGADLRNIKLQDLNLKGADLTDAKLSLEVEKVGWEFCKDWRDAKLDSPVRKKLEDTYGKEVCGKKVLMLMWEFPPVVSGGGWTAAYHLIRNLRRLESDILIVVPWLKSESIECSPFGHEVTIISAGMDSGASFKLNKQSYERLKEDGLPIYLLNKLKNLENNLYTDVTDFVDAIEQAIGSEQTIEYKTAILKSATYSGCYSTYSTYGPSKQHRRSNFQEVDSFNDKALQLLELKLAKKEIKEFDIIHAHDWLTFEAAELIARKFEKPWIAHFHSIENDRRRQEDRLRKIEGIERRVCRRLCNDKDEFGVPKKIIVPGKMLKKDIIQLYKAEEDKITIVPNSLSLRDYSLRRLGNFDSSRVIFVGRLSWQKAPDLFVKLAKEVKEKRPKTEFVMYGTGDEEKFIANFIEQVNPPEPIEWKLEGETPNLSSNPRQETPLHFNQIEKIKEGFKITEQSLDYLRLERFPDRILRNLEEIKNKEISGKKEFLRKLKETIGEEEYLKYESFIFENVEEDKCITLTEDSLKELKEGLKLTDKSLEVLLRAIRDKKNSGVEEFLDTLKKLMSKEQYEKYKYLILEYSKKSETFKINDKTIEKLSDFDKVLKNLKNIKNKEFTREDKFLKELKTTIGEKQTEKYKSLILESARFIKRLGKLSVKLHERAQAQILERDFFLIPLQLDDSYTHKVSSEASYKITKQSLEDMREATKVPDEVLLKLETIKEKEIEGGKEFLEKLKETIDDEQQYEKYKNIILVHTEKLKKFKLTDKSLIELLKKYDTFSRFLGKLETIKSEEFEGEEKFVEKLEETIGKEQAQEYKLSILKKYADKSEIFKLTGKSFKAMESFDDVIKKIEGKKDEIRGEEKDFLLKLCKDIIKDDEQYERYKSLILEHAVFDESKYLVEVNQGMFPNYDENLQKFITLKGFQQWEDRASAYENATVVVVPSRSEPFGMVVLEAMQYGVPVMFPEESGARAVLNSGIPFNPDDTEAAVELLLRLLEDKSCWYEAVDKQLEEIERYWRKGARFKITEGAFPKSRKYEATLINVNIIYISVIIIYI